MYQLILFIHVLIAIALIALILLQQGKGAEMGAAFGSGASQTVFGSQGSGSFLMKVTGMLAMGFFVTSISLAVIAGHQIVKVEEPKIVIPPTSTESNQPSTQPTNNISVSKKLEQPNNTTNTVPVEKKQPVKMHGKSNSQRTVKKKVKEQ
ncbi:MAG: preprotein translocase subunit SecG [Proteobacteria bacterium]|nr:preprotein translocase subunit SecG [Pseudomonadota bacterium]